MTIDRVSKRAVFIMAKILIPTPLRPFTDKQDAVDAAGTTVGELLADLTRKHSGLKAHLYNEQGKLRSFVNVYVNDEDIRYLQKEQTPVTASDTVSIIPSVAGGADGEKGYGPLSTTAVAEKGPYAFSDRELPTLTNDDVRRYSRHLIMPEVGVEGQRKLKAAKVLCIGAGGLGSPVAMYLAAAGVGTIGLVDFDVVDFSNLQRQILHSTPDVGRPKLQSAKEKLNALNPEIEIRTHDVALSSQNALQLFEPYDVIVDGTDNFPTRYLVNDACVLLGKPNAYGSIFRFEGQASVFATKDGPCYRCLYPEPPPPGLVPSCAEGGVLGVLPGVIGTIQATEAIKLILGVGEPLAGRLLLVDTLAMRFRTVTVRRDPACPACGTREIRELIDYEQFCGVRAAEAEPRAVAGFVEITPRELTARLSRGEELDLIDVREQFEWDIVRIPGARLVPLATLPDVAETLDKDREIVVYCKGGARSRAAASHLADAGFRRVANLTGGVLRWRDEVDPAQPRY